MHSLSEQNGMISRKQENVNFKENWNKPNQRQWHLLMIIETSQKENLSNKTGNCEFGNETCMALLVALKCMQKLGLNRFEINT